MAISLCLYLVCVCRWLIGCVQVPTEWVRRGLVNNANLCYSNSVSHTHTHGQKPPHPATHMHII